MPSVIAYGCDDATTQFHPLQIDIREPGEGDIYFDVGAIGANVVRAIGANVVL